MWVSGVLVFSSGATLHYHDVALTSAAPQECFGGSRWHWYNGFFFTAGSGSSALSQVMLLLWRSLSQVMFALSRIRRHLTSCWYSRYMHFGYDFFNSIIAFRCSRVVINGTRSTTGVALCSFLRSGETLSSFLAEYHLALFGAWG